MSYKYYEPGNFVPAFPPKELYEHVFESLVKKHFPEDVTDEIKPVNPYDFMYRPWVNWTKRVGRKMKDREAAELFDLAYLMFNRRDKNNPKALNRYNKEHVNQTFEDFVQLEGELARNRLNE